MSIEAALSSATTAIVTVGPGRGFVVEVRRSVRSVPGLELPPLLRSRYVITAAHCLPELPSAHPFSLTHERTYRLLGPLGGKPSIAVECLVVDPIADLAVLGAPDGRAGFDEAAYEAFVDGCSALRVGTVDTLCDAWLFTLAGQWDQCSVRVNEYGQEKTLVLVGADIRGGMSGSPIVTATGAVGIVSVGAEVNGVQRFEQHQQPRLAHALPVWLLKELTAFAEADDRA
jgi:hypothetical protein